MNDQNEDGIMDRPVFVDIDGTLTDKKTKGGNVIPKRLKRITDMLAAGHQIVMWSGGGTAYVKWFCEQHRIKGAIMIGKPELCVDDNPLIRPKSLQVQTPEEFFK
jgi:hydroxymethylpyrimidine pyrophosphatase-like HAD family hydrolase